MERTSCGLHDFFYGNFLHIGDSPAVIVFWCNGHDLIAPSADFDADRSVGGLHLPDIALELLPARFTDTDADASRLPEERVQYRVAAHAIAQDGQEDAGSAFLHD